MKANKCKHCGLINTADDVQCRRCGHILFGERREETHSPRQDARRFSLAPLLVVVAIAGAGYFLYNGISQADKDIRENHANSLPANLPTPSNRTEAEQKQKGQFFNAVQNSNGIKQADSHTQDINKLMGEGNTAAK